MQSVAAVFSSRDDARRAAAELSRTHSAGYNVNLLLPEASGSQIAAVPVSDTEQPGVGAAIGGVVGGALGLASGFEIGVGVSALIPGVGPVLAIGGAAAALLGLGGAIGGSAMASAVDTQITEGLSADEIFFYEDALRQGRSVVIAMAQNHEDAEWTRKFFARSGAETVDAARKAWWIGLRNAEGEHYRALGENFEQEEHQYQAGFEAALRRDLRGKDFVEAMDYLAEAYPQIWQAKAFRAGFERGRRYLGTWEKSGVS